VQGCTYSISVQAENEAGFGDWSTPTEVFVIGLSSAPQYCMATTKFSMQTDLSWLSPTDTGGLSPDNALIHHYVVHYVSSGIKM
jgi:hypothetical protein